MIKRKNNKKKEKKKINGAGEVIQIPDTLPKS